MKKFTEAEKELIWNRHKVWVQVKHIAREMGRLSRSLRKLICTPGGIRPRPRVRSELRLSCDEREEIPLGLSGGCRSGRLPRVLPMPLTMSREVNAKGGRRGYRALKADDAASGRARRPQVAKIASCPRLRAKVLVAKCHPRRSRAGWLGPIRTTRGLAPLPWTRCTPLIFSRIRPDSHSRGASGSAGGSRSSRCRRRPRCEAASSWASSDVPKSSSVLAAARAQTLGRAPPMRPDAAHEPCPARPDRARPVLAGSTGPPTPIDASAS